MSENNQQVQTLLEDLQELHPEIDGSALISSEGVVLNSTFPCSFETDTLAAMVSALVVTVQESAEEFSCKQTNQIVIGVKKGFVILRKVSQQRILLVLIGQKIKPTMFLVSIQGTAEKIKTYIS